MRGGEDAPGTRLAAGEEAVFGDFLAAVRAHLESPAAAAVGGVERFEEAAHLLHRALGPGGEAALVEGLLADPVLLASFFQNADRLDTSRPPGALVARSILRAVHSATELEGS